MTLNQRYDVAVVGLGGDGLRRCMAFGPGADSG